MRTIAALAVLAALLVPAAATPAPPKTFKLKAVLTAAQEVPKPAGVPAGARGTFTATVDLAKGTMTWRLTWSKLSGPNLGSHIHLGGPGKVNPMPSLDLCGTQLSGTGKPCTSGKTVVFGPNTPVFPEDLAKLATTPMYVNVHTGANTSGEIRGQLKVVR